MDWIKNGEHIEILCQDTGWIKIRACQKRAELKQQKEVDDKLALKASMDADLFDVIQLSVKTEEQIHELIAENKFLTYFAKDHRIGIRVRAKKQMKEYIESKRLNDVWWELNK